MTSLPEQPTCEVCGRPATERFQDLELASVDAEGWAHWQRHGEPHATCLEHARRPRFYRSGQQIADPGFLALCLVPACSSWYSHRPA